MNPFFRVFDILPTLPTATTAPTPTTTTTTTTTRTRTTTAAAAAEDDEDGDDDTYGTECGLLVFIAKSFGGRFSSRSIIHSTLAQFCFVFSMYYGFIHF